MTRILSLMAVVLLWTGRGWGQSLEVLEVGPDDRVVQLVREELDAAGNAYSVTNVYTEVASGLNYWDGTTYQPSVPEFSIIGTEAVADQGQTKMVLPANLNVPGAVYVVDREGKEYRSTPSFLALRDPANNHGIAIAALQDTVGEQVAPDQVLYRDAFDLVAAAVRLSYRLDGTEQDIVLYEPLDPQQWGMPENSVLESWTETFNWPDPVSVEVTQAGTLDDVRLRFGGLDIGQGSAFSLENATSEVPVGKRFGKVGDRTFLVERVPYAQIKPMLDSLPAQAGGKRSERLKRMAGLGKPGTDAEMVAAVGQRRGREPRKETLVAEGVKRGRPDHRPGVVLDYATVISGSAYVFDGGTTYYVSGTVNLAGATLIGGAVIKMDSTAATTMNFTGPVTCKTSAYRPVIVTAKTDNTVGGFVVASDTGNPLPRNFGTPAIKLNAAGTAFVLHDIAVRRAAVAIRLEAGSLSATNVQIVSCGTGIYKAAGATTVGLRNVLADDVGVMFDGAGASGGANAGYHLTVHRVPVFGQGTFAPIALVNSLLISATNTAGYFTDPNASVVASLADTGVFTAPVGGGNHYLAAVSSYRGIGIALSDPQLAAEIASRTTFPPAALSGVVSFPSPLVLRPQVPRNIGAPDLGYHYSAVDVLATGLEPSGGLILTNGVVVACAGTSGVRVPSGDYSIPFVSQGTAEKPNRIVWQGTVQEQALTTGAAPGSRSLIEQPYTAATTPSLTLRFTDTSLMSDDGWILYLGSTFNLIVASLDAKDCQFHGGQLRMGPNTPGMGVWLQNNLFEWTTVAMNQNASINGTQPFTLTMRNNTFKAGTLASAMVSFSKQSAVTTWTVKANLFDSVVSGSVGSGVTIANTHNAYRSGATQLPGAANSKVITTFNYLVGPFGSYYYGIPSSAGTLNDLDGAGDVSPASAGLKHHTVNGTTRAKDVNSLVAIGMHYVAMDPSSVVFDGDQDGMPDYLEDANGNGTTDSGETNWQSYTSANGLSSPVAIVPWRP